MQTTFITNDSKWKGPTLKCVPLVDQKIILDGVIFVVKSVIHMVETFTTQEDSHELLIEVIEFKGD